MRIRGPQRGFTLVEFLIAAAIAALLIAPLARALRDALGARAFANEANDVTQQATFAMQRMVAAVRNTAPHALSSKAATTTADWLAPVTYCLNGAGQLLETTPLDVLCALGTTVIADGVSAFSVQTYSAGANAATVIEIRLTVTGAGGQSIALTSHTRLGGGTL
jgi:prepilin-type N-terminal cleavage/methylation domain-containing protein